MKDIQSMADNRKVPIQKVGIKNLRVPITVLDREHISQDTVAKVSMTVDLPHRFKGTHMSRFVEIINAWRGRVSVNEMDSILEKMLERFDSSNAHVEIRFPYFIEKKAPVSGVTSLMDFECAFLASMSAKKRISDLILEVIVPVNTLCPCSKEISENGAHNQRSLVTVRVRTRQLVWLEDLIEIAESESSAPLYSMLKREDEKFITEKAYANPRFVEDVVRGVAIKLKKDKRITWFEVESENFESIHNHSAYAMVKSIPD